MILQLSASCLVFVAVLIKHKITFRSLADTQIDVAFHIDFGGCHTQNLIHLQPEICIK